MMPRVVDDFMMTWPHPGCWTGERERDEAVDRVNAAEASLSRVEKITAAERAVVRAAVEHAEASDIAPTWGCLCDAVRALRDAQETGQ